MAGKKKSDDDAEVTVSVDAEPQGVRVAVEGTCVDWKRQVQVNPKTGQLFDFDGRLL